MSALSLRMKELREERGLTQMETARRLGISYPAYRRYEQGERELPLSAAVRMADLYEVSLDYLVGRSEARERI